MAKHQVTVRLVMEATYEIDPSGEGYSVDDVRDAIEIDRKALMEPGYDNVLAMEAMSFEPVGFEVVSITPMV